MKVLLCSTLLLCFSRALTAQEWHTLQPGLSWTEQSMRVGKLQHPVRAVIARIDPRKFDLSLQLLTRANRMTGAWNVDSVAADVAVAFNAGQFKETGPWGWLVIDGVEQRNPGFGPLSVGIAIDTAGRVRWLRPAQMQRARSDRSIRYAFQSYPLLIFEGRTAQMLLMSDDVDRAHRDARLILGETADGSLLVVLTRYEGFGGVAERVPVGLTVIESARLLSRLGARYAVMLDGGLSAQLLMRDAGGNTQKWKGLRDVPLALQFRPRAR